MVVCEGCIKAFRVAFIRTHSYPQPLCIIVSAACVVYTSTGILSRLGAVAPSTVTAVRRTLTSSASRLVRSSVTGAAFDDDAGQMMLLRRVGFDVLFAGYAEIST